jgi:hypothetical protein
MCVQAIDKKDFYILKREKLHTYETNLTGTTRIERGKMTLREMKKGIEEQNNYIATLKN